jgi:HD-GYP domain-containing protein (c-di-GMP phosphodiesterase class II)
MNYKINYNINEGIDLIEVLSALSHALDITEGQKRGHSFRTAFLAIELAKKLNLNQSDIFDLYCAGLLKDSGCSSNASRVYKTFDADDLTSKYKVKFIDWSNFYESFKFAIKNTKPSQNLFYKISHLLVETKGNTKLMDELTSIRCNKGFEIAISLGFSYNIANAIKFLDEHWDGNGSPYKIKGEKIPLFSRILCLCQTFEVFASNFGLSAAFDIINKRKAKWFDPFLVDLFNSLRNDNNIWEKYYNFIENYNIVDVGEEIIKNNNKLNISTRQIAETFALIIDAKTSFTYNHSKRVADYCALILQDLNAPSYRIDFMYIAGLLHDIGKLGISNKILEKPGKLDDSEFEMIKLHPKYSYEILKNIKVFDYLAIVAGAHHERLDGKGYYQGLAGDELNEDMRILAVADVFDALRSERPYRPALELDKVFNIMENDKGLDQNFVSILKSIFL